MTDDLLQPTITGNVVRGARPWRLSSQFWVAFFGGALACGTIAIINAGRLGVSRRQRWVMAALTALTLAILLALWFQRTAADFSTFWRGARDLRIYGRIASVALYLAMAAIQRRRDAQHQVFADAEYASLWGPGLAAVFGLGTVQPLLLAGIAWFAR